MAPRDSTLVNYRYEIAVREETGNWEASLSLNGTLSDTITTDSGSYTCEFQFSSGESYNQTTQLQFYSKFNVVEFVTIWLLQCGKFVTVPFSLSL